MRGKLSPGLRARLAALNIDAATVGRMYNKVAPAPIAPKTVPVPRNSARPGSLRRWREAQRIRRNEF